MRDVVFRDIQLTVSGGGTEKDATRIVPELIDAYPDAFSFGATVPAYGFWIRHADQIFFDRITVSPRTPDARPCFGIGEDTARIVLPVPLPDANPLK